LSKICFIKKNWLSKIPAKELEDYAVQYPLKYWKKLIDLLHAKPTDLQLPWFTAYIFTGECPTDTLAYKCMKINKDTICDIATTHKLPYNYLRVQHEKLMTPTLLDKVFDYTCLSDILTHWDSFSKCDNSASKLVQRITSGEDLNVPYGELMKRIQTLEEEGNESNKGLVTCLIDVAEKKLNSYMLNIEQPVAVLGDASASMDVAIKTSSIIMSILCSACNANMHLFNESDLVIENPPRNVTDVINLSKTFKADGCTAPCASLYPYYAKKEVVKTFILVTDEEENTGYDKSYNTDLYFAPMFKKYSDEVYPAKLVFVSFVPDNKDGPMVRHLKQKP
jgi:hypothetical protein